MSIDINAFRSIANQSPDKFVYAQGDTLKASHSDAFLKACVDHYGSQMGSAIVRFLQDDIEGGKPLTARKIKALVEFADEKMGSATKVDVGGKEVELEKIGTDSMSRVGFSRESKIAKAKAGQQTSSAATLAAFKFGAPRRSPRSSSARTARSISTRCSAISSPSAPTSTARSTRMPCPSRAT